MDDSSKFNSYLQQISQQLSHDDLEYLKFLCEWVIPESSRRMESVRSGVDLFKLLKDEAKLSAEGLVFLKWIFTSIRREYILVLDGYFVAEAAKPLSAPQRFAECLVEIAQSLTSQNMGELLFLFRGKLQFPTADWTPPPTQLFLELRKQLLLNETDVSTLREALRDIRRLDLVSRIDYFLTAQLNKEVEQNLKELRDDFFHLTNGVEDSLKNSGINLEVLTRRFRILPSSIRRQEEAFSEIRQRALKSTTIKELFDNLTELKHWSYMTPEILTYIIQDVKEVHFDMAVYESKLLHFKTKTKLKDLISWEFLLPDFYMELHIKVRGWQEKTIDDAEKSVHTLLARAGYRDPKVGGLQGVRQGCIELVYVLLESIDGRAFSNKELFNTYEADGILSISINQVVVYSREGISSVKGETATSTSDITQVAGREVEWYGSGSLEYSAQGGRDVLIIEADLPLPDPQVVSRRTAHLTDDDRQKLKSQGISSDDLHEASIIRARYEYDKRRTLFRVLRSESDHQLRRQEVYESITELFRRTKNDGVIVYYIGAGRRGAGDWCFEDGFITFRDIAQLYLRASHNFKGRVLTIVSDCSYSGCWVRDCMVFLDEQGVQPCGHKAREKGILIKVYASCGPTQIPMQYQFSVHGASSDKNTGHIFSYTSKQLLETQHTYSVNSSVIRCAENKEIEDDCELLSDYTWQKWKKKEQIHLIIDESRSCPTWQFVLLEENEAKIWEFKEKRAKGEPIDVTQYGQVLESGWGREPPNEVKHEIERKYDITNK